MTAGKQTNKISEYLKKKLDAEVKSPGGGEVKTYEENLVEAQMCEGEVDSMLLGESFEYVCREQQEDSKDMPPDQYNEE